MPLERRLYLSRLSGNSHKVRLFLGLLGLEYAAIEVDLRGGEHKRAPFLALNPLGQVPVLVDGDVTLADSQAILVYLARRYAAASWLPLDPVPLAQITRWLSIAANEIQHGPATARLIAVFGAKLDGDLALQRSAAILAYMQAHLTQQPWLVGDHPTIADMACYPYVALAPEGHIDLQSYPQLSRWLARVEALPGFVPMYSPAATA
jgi:glutathione S-transferase